MSDRLLNSFEQNSQNNTQEIKNLITEFQQIMTELNTIPKGINELHTAILKETQQTNSQFNNSINSANQQIKNITKKFDNLL
ncbi:MAG: hypothetical protein QNJ60_08825 [Xenococcaceae cyanobacterium MO_188.B19]|nr:hypothetical protein [Xenococcaceae cyanobacterium MO_188.B19]